MEKFNLILVDDHPLYRIGLRDIIKKHLPEANILAEYESGIDLLENLENLPTPDILLLDIIMPGISGIKTAKIIREKYPDIKIVMLSAEVSKEYIEVLLDIGVAGYLNKLAAEDVLINAIKEVLSGNQFWGQTVSKILYDIYISTQKSSPSATGTKQATLTPKEEEVVVLLCEGLTLKEIAQKLNLSPRTIDTHKANVMKKMNFHSIVDIVKYAIKEGIIVV